MPTQLQKNVATETYHSEFKLLPDQAVLLRQRRVVTESVIVSEVWGDTWSFAFGDFSIGALGIRHGREVIPVVGKVGLFFPKHSMMEWHFYPGVVSFDCILSEQCQIPDLPSKAIMVSYPDQQIPKSAEETAELLLNSRQIQTIEHCRRPHPVAERARKLIHQHFRDSCEIGWIAKRLDVAEAVLSRVFKKSFRVTPVSYRNNLRVTGSLWNLLSQKQNVSQTCSNSGFQDLSRFNKQFKRQVKATPSQYRFYS